MVEGYVRFRTRAGRWILLTTVLGSGMATLDGTVVNVALPDLGRDLHAGMSGLQWTINAYTLTLAAFILLGGSLGDRLGRRKIFLVGVAWFALASAACGLAPTTPVLVLARALQGIGGALLVPGSLAIIQATFAPDDRPRAVGAWSGLGGVAAAIGPLLGGWLVEVAGWRWVFLLNLPLAVLVAVTARHVPETRDGGPHGRFDVLGAALAAPALAGLTYGLILAGDGLLPLAAGVVLAVAFVVVETRRSPNALVPVGVFASREFTAVNVVTFVMYAAMGLVFFLLVVQLQVAAGFSPIAAGSAMLPVTILMLLLSSRAGELARRVGPRPLMTGGILGCAAGLLMMSRIGPGSAYLTDVVPAAVVFGLGLSAAVAPLTATVLATAEERYAGVASGVNNALARTGGLLAVAAVPPLVGLTGDAYNSPAGFTHGYRVAMLVCAAMMATAAVITFLTIRRNVLAAAPEPACRSHCAVEAPPLGDLPGDGTRHGAPTGPGPTG
ncbi:MFS transporter [Microbispora sp. RL4-1S]|uniref:MFS transporter n=1 Tax=Microbispora oryzae TaxID=2806554 RepID=A0A941AHG9_9ACTN|nr:MFS transporter [Microbispora oryzae]MBP2704080.1 MFS transporter [Microbispora oryzae]